MREGEDSEVMEEDRVAASAARVLEAKTASLYSLIMGLSDSEVKAFLEDEEEA